MPERWEREVRKLTDVEPREHVIRDRAAQGPSQNRLRPRRNALVAGLVAGAVAIASVAFLGQLDDRDREIVGGADDLPTLLVMFESNGTIGETPSDAEPIRRVDTTISYGDAREEDFTSTTPVGAHVDYLEVERVTAFVPGPTAGSPVRIEADGEDARVLIGQPGDWPKFDRFTQIDRLPEEPGDYVLVFEAKYAEGVARTARRVHVVTPGVLQLDVTEGESLDAAVAAAYVDGRRTDGFLSTSWFMQSDVGGQMEPRAPSFPSDGWLELLPGSPMVLASDATEARAGLFESYPDFDHNDRLPIDLLGSAGVIDGPDGRHLLAVDVSWKHGQTGWAHNGTEERAIFFFPIEIVPVNTGIPSPTADPSATPAPVSADTVVIDIRRSSEETGDPEAIARFGSQEQWMCPDGWSVVNADGTRDEILFDCGQNAVFQAPVGTPIVVAGDFATVNVSTRVNGDQVPGSSDEVPALEAGSILTLGYEVTWDDGSEASLWLLLTVQDTGSVTEEPGIVVWIYGLGERSTEVPIITMTYGGETKRGCTEAFDWTLPDGTRIDEAAGGGGSLPLCSPDPLFRVPPGIPITVEVPTAIEMFVTRTTTPLNGGIHGFGASVTWPSGRGDFTVTFEVVGSPSDHDIELDCAEEDRIAFTTPDGPRILPGGSAYIRGNMEGFLQTDVIEQMTRSNAGSSEWDGVWQVVRDGSVIAAVEYGTLGGVACLGSGIGGV
jgi:hypothetical protein